MRAYELLLRIAVDGLENENAAADHEDDEDDGQGADASGAHLLDGGTHLRSRIGTGIELCKRHAYCSQHTRPTVTGAFPRVHAFKSQILLRAGLTSHNLRPRPHPNLSSLWLHERSTRPRLTLRALSVNVPHLPASRMLTRGANPNATLLVKVVSISGSR